MKSVKQISIFVENTAGRMAAILSELAENNININALSIADTSDFGILRLIVNDPDKAYDVIKKKGLSARITNVVAVEMSTEVGGLADVLSKLSEAGVNIEYMYAFNGRFNNSAVVILRVDDNEKLIGTAEKHGLKLLDPEEAYSL